MQRALDKVPDSVLQTVLDFLKEVETHASDKIDLTMNVKKILTEDKELLERLAKWLRLMKLKKSTTLAM